MKNKNFHVLLKCYRARCAEHARSHSPMRSFAILFLCWRLFSVFSLTFTARQWRDPEAKATFFISAQSGARTRAAVLNF